MNTFSDMQISLEQLVEDMGYTRTANAITNLYNSDQLEYHIAVALKAELAEMYWRDYVWYEADEEVEAKCESLKCLDHVVEVEAPRNGLGQVSIGDAAYNRFRLENSQLTQWVDNPIHDHPRNQIVVGHY